MILVLDFGGQYNQLIARRVRELSVYSEVRPYTMPIEEIKALNPTGIILTGGPDVVFEDGAPRCSAELFSLGIPVLLARDPGECCILGIGYLTENIQLVAPKGKNPAKPSVPGV